MTHKMMTWSTLKTRVDISDNKSGPGHKLLDKHLHTAIPNSTREDYQKLQEQSMSAIIQDKRTQVPCQGLGFRV
jgi:hypothetical protein